MKRQRIQFAHTDDDVTLAWARMGSGPVLVKAANWLTHLQYDWESPVWRHWMDFLGDHFSFVRYDERGCGMSDRNPDDVSEGKWLPDLETVIEVADIDEPMVLLGVSQGAVTVIRYAVEHPERVSRLILYGGYAHGWEQRGGDQERHYHAVLDMMRVGWGSDNPVFRQAFCGRFIPGASHEQIDWFNDLCRKTATPDMAVRLLEARGDLDIADLLGRVRVPTRVIHARHDEVVPFSQGRLLAREIPGAEFVELDSANHVLLAHEPAWEDFKQAVLDFVGISRKDDASALESLTRRERQIFGLLARGLSNAEIAGELHISEKTVRNHLSSVYDKMGVSSRAQAIVKAGRLPGS